MKLKEIADRIDAHLKRFERDPKINLDRSPNKTGFYTYFWAGSCVAGRYVRVVYISYQRGINLSKDEAARYLAALESGFIGRHYDALKARKASDTTDTGINKA